MNKEKIMEVVIETLINVVNDIPELSGAKIDETTQLLTEGSFIDSLTLVSFVVELEAKLADNFNLDISLTDDKAMTREISPFENVRNLTDYIYELISSN